MYNFLIAIVLFFCVRLSYGDSYQFIYKNEVIGLSELNEQMLPAKKEKILNNFYLISDMAECFSNKFFIGGLADYVGYDYALYHVKKNRIKKLLDIPYGKFIKHGNACYVLYVNQSNPHFSVSYLFKLSLEKNKDFTYSLIYKLPGNLSYYAINQDLIVYGFVNMNPFALFVDSNGNWNELRYVGMQSTSK